MELASFLLKNCNRVARDGMVIGGWWALRPAGPIGMSFAPANAGKLRYDVGNLEDMLENDGRVHVRVMFNT